MSNYCIVWWRFIDIYISIKRHHTVVYSNCYLPMVLIDMYSNLKLLLNYCSSNTKLLSNCCTVWWHFIDIYCKWLLDLPLHNYLVHSYLPLILSTLEPKICKDDNIQLCYEMVASSYKESRNNVTCIYIVWYGMVHGLVCMVQSLVWYGTEFSMVWYRVWYVWNTVWYGMVQGLVWYGTGFGMYGTEFGMVWYRVWYVW